MEEFPVPTIFDIIDPTITVSADSSFVMSVTELKTKILILLCLTPDDFARQRETPWE